MNLIRRANIPLLDMDDVKPAPINKNEDIQLAIKMTHQQGIPESHPLWHDRCYQNYQKILRNKKDVTHE